MQEITQAGVRKQRCVIVRGRRGLSCFFWEMVSRNRAVGFQGFGGIMFSLLNDILGVGMVGMNCNMWNYNVCHLTGSGTMVIFVMLKG